MRGFGRAAVALLLVLGCSSGGSAPPATTSALPSGSTARVGSELVSDATVSRIAASQAVAPRQAVELALSDALFAVEARASLPLGATRSIERAAAARSLLEQLSQDAARAGAPTPAELAELARERWVELDRPSAVRTTHAIVMNDKPGRDADARALAENLAAAVRGATTSDELIRLAQAVPPGGFQIRAEALPFVTADGRTFVRKDAGFKATPGNFDPDFARAANELSTPGELSPVVKSSFGYHVIRLEERVPSAVVGEAELRDRLAPDVLARRASRARGQLLDKLRQASPVEVERAVNELTARVQAP
ncbi:MAG: peptidyl-prolyl cis-trans isomerase [Myxococcales bacterium]